MAFEADRRLFLALGLTLPIGCGAVFEPFASVPVTPAPLASGEINPIFVVSEDLRNNESTDFNSVMPNSTNQGMQRTLLMGSYLRCTILGDENLTEINRLSDDLSSDGESI